MFISLYIMSFFLSLLFTIFFLLLFFNNLIMMWLSVIYFVFILPGVC